jgi:hypothetical protein
MYITEDNELRLQLASANVRIICRKDMARDGVGDRAYRVRDGQRSQHGYKNTVFSNRRGRQPYVHR